MGTFDFWQKWLVVASVFFVVFGVAAATLNETVLFQLYNSQLTKAFWQSAEMPEDVKEFKAFILGPLGGTIAGSFLLQAFIAHIPFKRREKWAYNASVASLLLWFTVDSSVSLYHGAVFNVLLVNLVSLIAIGLPLLFTWKYFHSDAPISP